MRKKLTKEQVNLSIADRGIWLIGEYVNNKTKSEFMCGSGHTWTASVGTVKNTKSGCPHCSHRAPLSKDIVNERLSSTGIEMIGDYMGIHIKTKFQCVNGHTWDCQPNSVLSHGTNCPHCTKYGFDSTKSTVFYILDFGKFIKYGITNNLDSRTKNHRRNGEYTILLTKMFEDGKIAQQLEKKIKSTLGGRFVDKEQCPDGYTETLCPSKLSELMAIIDQNI